MPEQIALEVNRARYSGWKSVRVMRSMEHIAGGFELSVSDRWPGQDEPIPINPGDPCTVAIDEDVIITGYVDEVDRAHDARSHEIGVRGRDKTGDLVDCSAVPYRQWINRKMEQIASDLLNPFGIGLLTLTDTGPAFPTFAIEPGEPVFDALDRMSRICGVLMMSNGTGDLVIARRSSERIGTALVVGENILSARVALSMMDRYSQYIVLGDRSLGGSQGDTLKWDDASQRKGIANDASVERYRPLVILSESQGDAANFQTRADWERSVRAARAARATITVQGWRHADDLWRPNKLVRVIDRTLGLDADLLISAVTFTLDEGGRRTELSLTHPGAFDLIPIETDKKRDFVWGLT